MKDSEAVTHKCIELLSIYLVAEDKYPDYNESRKLTAKRSLLADQLGVDFVNMLEQTISV